MSIIDRNTALCGHPQCDPYQPRNSVLDEAGDVVIYHACHGTKHVFRDNAERGLILHGTDHGWTLTRDGETEPVVEGGEDGYGRYAARWLPSGRVLVRTDTQYGLIAKAARRLLRPETNRAEA
jgi:hypothetical protein